jgi:hypothetical protein
VHAAVAHVHAVDNGITYRGAALDDSPAHDRYVVCLRRSTILQTVPSAEAKSRLTNVAIQPAA